MFLSDLEVKKVIGHSSKYVLLSDLRYESDKFKVTVPSGTETDLTTMYPEGRYTHCSVLHDYLLNTGHGWRKANAVMFEALRSPQLNVKWYNRLIIRVGVRIYSAIRIYLFGDLS